MTDDRLAVQWTREGMVAGLLRGIFPVPDDMKGAATVALLVDGVEVWSAPLSRHFDGCVHLNIHTPLLLDGRSELTVAVESESGRRAGTGIFLISNQGKLADRTRDALKSADVPVAFLGDCDSSYYERARSHVAHWMENPSVETEIEAKLADRLITESEADLLRRFVRDGFVVLDELLPEAMITAADEALDMAVKDGYQGYRYGESTRLEQMHREFPAIRDIWLYAPIHRFLSLVFDSPSQPCQSLVYIFGSQQDAHQDTIHLTPFPAGHMCGVWIALEDVRPDSGELLVYPGSHRLPRVYMKDVGCRKVRSDWQEFGEKVVRRWAELLDESGIKAAPYLARRGQILVWHENLMHAGSVRRDRTLSRRSIVTHNFAQGAIVYYDSSGNVGYVHDHRECIVLS
jgi:hypothetical protein